MSWSITEENRKENRFFLFPFFRQVIPRRQTRVFFEGGKKWNSEPCFFTKSVGRRFQELSFGVSGCKLGDLAREMGPRAWFLKNKGKKLKKL